MPLTLEQYVERLAERTDLPWPTAPKVEPVKAKPSLQRFPVRAVMWTVYGTLVAVPQGELLFEHPQDFVTDAALDKLIKEFKMWNSMSRKPGAPAQANAQATTDGQPPKAGARAGKGHDRIELDPTQITGNRELPKVLYIVPWKRSDLGDLTGRPQSGA